MSIPRSAIAATTVGLSAGAGSEPPDSTATPSPAMRRAKAAAIRDRPALWTHRNRIDAVILQSVAPAASAKDLDDVAVRDDVVATDPLPVEPRRRAPHASPDRRGGEVVMDQVRDVDDGCRRMQRDRLVVDAVVGAEPDPDQTR